MSAKSSSPWRRRCRLALALFVYLLALIGLADVFTALLFLPRMPQSVRPAHLYYHHGFVEDTTHREPWGDRVVEITANSVGLRDVMRREVTARPKTYRILFLGDSMVEGQGVPGEASFTEVFQRLAANDGIQVEALNGGVASHSPTLLYYHLLYLVEIRKLHFDEIFVFLDISDAQDDIFYRHFTPHDYCFLISQRIAAYLSRYSTIYRKLIGPSGRHGIETAIRPMCAAFSQLSPNPLQGHIPDKTAPPLRDVISSLDEQYRGTAGLFPWELEAAFWPKGYLTERYGWVYDGEVASRWGTKGQELSEHYLGLLARYARRKRIALTLCIYPNPYNLLTGAPTLFLDRWSEFAAQRGLRLFSLYETASFSHADPEKLVNDLFISKEIHWNEAGHEAVAKELLALWKKQTRSNGQSDSGR